MYKNLFFNFFLVMIITVASVHGQKKLEKEYRIQASEVPEKALQFVNSFAFQKKVKWYREKSLEGISIEAKTKSEIGKLSIEFGENGNLQDVEVKVSWDNIPKGTKKTIKKYFKDTFKRYGLRKIQKQYTGSPEQVKKALQVGDNTEVEIKYEIIAKGKQENVRLYEFLFTGEGVFVEKAEIIFRPTDNLQF